MIRLITQSDDSQGVRYFIAQHMPDMMRKEVRNIGVVVEKGDSRSSLFVGQRDPNSQIDGRALRTFDDPRVYKMWVRHWQSQLASDDWEDRLLHDSKVTYSIIPGGEVSDTGGDSADQICAYLYGLLVSDGGLTEALGAETTDDAAEIRSDLRSELRKLKIMKSIAPGWCKRPVYEHFQVRGLSEWQQVTFYQEMSGGAIVFEPMNLTTRLKWHVRERAGYLAFLFDDLRRYAEKESSIVNTTAVVRVNPEDRDDTDVKFALSVLENHSNVVDWSDARQRKNFLREREEVARSVA